jgi:hypothetical protein
MSVRKFSLLAATAAIATCGALAATVAHAHGAPVDVQWSVTIGTPAVALPLPRVVAPVIVPAPQPVVVVPAGPPPRFERGYREPTRWDVDGDGIPNRYDRVYNPAWDRNGNGIPDGREFRHRPYADHGDRDHDGIPNRYDRRDDRFDGRTDRRFDDRRPIAYPR